LNRVPLRFVGIAATRAFAARPRTRHLSDDDAVLGSERHQPGFDDTAPGSGEYPVHPPGQSTASEVKFLNDDITDDLFAVASS